MNSYKDLYKLIDNLKIRIKKLDYPKYKNNSLNNSLNNSVINSYRIFSPAISKSSKKYIGLLFDDNFNDFNTDSSNNCDKFLSFIKIKKGNLIINFSISFDIKSKINNQIFSISLGIRDKTSSKIKIIKGSKNYFNPDNNSLIFNNSFQINNTILYACSLDEELCMIGEFDQEMYIINYKKSLLKILYL